MDKKGKGSRGSSPTRRGVGELSQAELAIVMQMRQSTGTVVATTPASTTPSSSTARAGLPVLGTVVPADIKEYNRRMDAYLNAQRQRNPIRNYETRADHEMYIASLANMELSIPNKTTQCWILYSLIPAIMDQEEFIQYFTYSDDYAEPEGVQTSEGTVAPRLIEPPYLHDVRHFRDLSPDLVLLALKTHVQAETTSVPLEVNIATYNADIKLQLESSIVANISIVTRPLLVRHQ